MASLDLDRLTNLLQTDDIAYAEIVTYHFPKDSDMMEMRTTTINYHENDYQWATSSKPIPRR